MALDSLGVEETYAVFPFYLCLDVSASMAGLPIESVNRQMPQLRTAIGEDPAIAEVIRLAVITFSDVARTVLPLSDLSLVEAIPVLASEGRTNYGAAFEHLRRTIEGDYHSSRAQGERWYRPAVVFISDGQPTDAPEVWRAAHRRLVAPEWRRRPNVLSFGGPRGAGRGGRRKTEPSVHRRRGSRALRRHPRVGGRPDLLHRELLGQRVQRGGAAGAARCAEHDGHPRRPARLIR
jgi:uncharacterized protein YegL